MKRVDGEVAFLKRTNLGKECVVFCRMSEYA